MAKMLIGVDMLGRVDNGEFLINGYRFLFGVMKTFLK